ncbi:MAG TPA: hypothetical protein PK864_11085 [Syntrophorhabdaceae bacterium]|nr:hypothetical protein [Syntrophorhabdaceae bacterium]HON86550.1 hypothetical protein [Syntrophorhabdaceae bacterium]HPP42871.1 hypothetical protein [Syntrophorhabdaceae bacterium]HQK47172.1 hypothetical protein [Syntrophorhabdaceae bacterium]HRV23572.1 hypothetical protein [Syntrophorhabdaceae bacterium]
MAEKNFDFKEGLLQYTTRISDFNGLREEIGDLKQWDDGFLAFSNAEFRIAHIDLPIDDLKERVNGKISKAEGYLMEVDLWRKKDGAYEELYVERDNRDFLIEKWVLLEQKDSESTGYMCFWRDTDVVINERSIFKKEEISAVEVIVPDVRLHIFITKKRG